MKDNPETSDTHDVSVYENVSISTKQSYINLDIDRKIHFLGSCAWPNLFENGCRFQSIVLHTPCRKEDPLETLKTAYTWYTCMPLG